MKQNMKLVSQWLAFFLVAAVMMPLFAFAQEAASQAVEAMSAAAPAAPAVAAATEPGLDVIFQQIMKAIGDWKALGWQAGLAMALTALVSTMKNSFLRGLIWSKLPEWSRVFIAPLFAVIAFALAMGKDFSWVAFWAAASTGVLAVYFHQMLDALKKAPFVGEKWKWLVDAIGKLFKKPEAAK